MISTDLMTARPSCYNPEPARCGVCDRRCRSNAEAFACEREHDREDPATLTAPEWLLIEKELV